MSKNHDSFREEYRRKDEAVHVAKERAALQQPSQGKIHKDDSNMEYESTYGKDLRLTPS